MEETINIVRQSIKELAKKCDYANSLDYAGFNKIDAGFGHSLARQDNWSDRQVISACELLLKYHKQMPHIDTQMINNLINELKIKLRNSGDNDKMTIGLLTDRNGNHKLSVSFPFNKQTVEIIKTIEGRRWDVENRRWEVPIQNLQRLKKMFPNASLTEEVKKYEESFKEKENYLNREFEEIKKEIDLAKPLPNGKTLFAHQQQGVLRMLKYHRQILADDMGLGKTIQSLVVAKILSDKYNWDILIICPVSLKENWEREAKSLKISTLRFSVHSWAKIPTPPDKDYILIADEAHYAQAGAKTIRGKNFLKLAENGGCKACYCLTGTPIKNGRPINLLPLLKATKHELSKDIRYYQFRYCNAHLRKMGNKNFWDITGSSHLNELNQRIKDVIIRRTKKECLDLPDKIRVLREAEFSAESKQLYEKTLNELRERYNQRLESGEIKEDGEAMVMLQHLAHAGAIGKIETAYELAEEIVEEGYQVVIFSTFIEPLKKLKEKFDNQGIGTELLIGDTKDRQKLVDNFLEGKSRVFLLSMAGGVGIDLYSANTIILINRAWTPGDVMQIEDRLHRIGQKNAVTSIWLQYGEVDKHVDEILESKSINISEVLKSRGTGVDDIITFAKKYFKNIN